jgi:hypothetical protein
MSSAGDIPTDVDTMEILATKAAATKAATKASKKERRMNLLKMREEETEQQAYDRDPVSRWKKVIKARHDDSDWIFLKKKIVSSCEEIKTASSSLTVHELKNAIGKICGIFTIYEQCMRRYSVAKYLLNNAVELQNSSEVQLSEEVRSLIHQAQQPLFQPDQTEIDCILEFHRFQMDRLESCLQEASARENAKIANEFLSFLTGIFPESHMSQPQILLLFCTFVKILVGRITFSPPSCKTTIIVSNHVQKKLAKNRNVDESIVNLSKICAEGDIHCLDCAGVHAYNILLLNVNMYDEAFRNMLYSLLSGHDTALKAFFDFCAKQCKVFCKPEKMSDPAHHVFLQYQFLIEMLISQFSLKENLFFEEYQGEIVKLILEKIGMTMEQVDSHVSAFLTNPSEFPTRN